MNKTWFVDIDGTLVRHINDNYDISQGDSEELLPYAVEFLEGIRQNGDCIILTTARLEKDRLVTVKMLKEFGLVYDQIIFGIGSRERILINDIKPKGANDNGYRDYTMPMAYAINVERDVGLSNILQYNFNQPIINQKDYVWELIQ